LRRRQRKLERKRKSHQLTVRFGDEEWAVIEEIANYLGYNYAEAIRWIVGLLKVLAAVRGIQIYGRPLPVTWFFDHSTPPLPHPLVIMCPSCGKEIRAGTPGTVKRGSRKTT